MSNDKWPDFNPATKNANMRAMAWVSFLHAVGMTTINSVFEYPHLPDYYYLFVTGIITAYFGFSKWGEIKGD